MSPHHLSLYSTKLRPWLITLNLNLMNLFKTCCQLSWVSILGGGWGDISPPWFWEGGIVNAFIPPWKWMKLCHILSELPYLSAWKNLITTIFDGLSLNFIIQLAEFIVNHWNKHDWFPNSSHIQVIYSVFWRVMSTTHKESLLHLPYKSFIWVISSVHYDI